MIAASARRESSNIAQYSNVHRNGVNLIRVRERLQTQQQDIDRFNQLRRQRRWARQASFRRDLRRRISKAFIVPTVFIIGSGVIITLCSCVAPIGRGTIFWESPHRTRYRLIGALLLLVGSIVMTINYAFYKRIRTGEQRERREQEIKNHECHLCRGMKNKQKRKVQNMTDNVSVDSDSNLISGNYPESAAYQYPDSPHLSRSGRWIGPKITQVQITMEENFVGRERDTYPDLTKFNLQSKKKNTNLSS